MSAEYIFRYAKKSLNPAIVKTLRHGSSGYFCVIITNICKSIIFLIPHLEKQYTM